MKTKKTTKERKQSREVKIQSDLEKEFGSVLNDDFLDEEAFMLVAYDEEYSYE